MSEHKYEINWHSSDIENRLGFRSNKFTGVSTIISFMIGAIFAGMIYGILMIFHNKGYLYIDMFFHGGEEKRSVIPYFIVFLTTWSLAILLLKNIKLRLQKKALMVNILPASHNFILTSHTAKEIIDNMRVKVDAPEKLILFDRIERAISNLKNLGNVSSVAECLKNQAENDDNFLTASYTILKGFIWAIPVLGFIGTVLGLADSVGQFGNVVKGSSDIDTIKTALGGVTSGLGTAFETTLIALVLAMIVQLIMTFTLNREEYFLDDCADYCHKNIISKMKSVSAQDLKD